MRNWRVLPFVARVALVAVVVAGCASGPAQKPSSASRSGAYYKDDGPPAALPSEFDRVADAEPRDEPLHRFANRQYTVFGVNYTPMTTLAPLRQRGTASWYGKKFHGQKTAIGETYDMFTMSAAHPTAPLPSFARVTGIRSGKSVVVRINDRGPFHAGRIVDLSYAAAHRIGLAQAGSGEVEFELLLPPHFRSGNPVLAQARGSETPTNARANTSAFSDTQTNSAPPINAPLNGAMQRFFVQLGAFGNFSNAQVFQGRMADELGMQPTVRQINNLFRVQLGPFASMSDAQAAQLAAHNVWAAHFRSSPKRQAMIRTSLRIDFLRYVRHLLIAASVLTLTQSARAQLTIDIVGVGAQQIPVVTSEFIGDATHSQMLTSVIQADLARSGVIKNLPNAGLPRTSEATIEGYAQYASRGADAAVVGSVTTAANGQFQITFRLLDVPKRAQLAGLVYNVAAKDMRATAHRIADVVYEKLTGDKGVFSTRLAYVAKTGSRYQLIVADSDGANAISIVSSNEPIISPAWSPDGERLAYVSFENRRPSVFVQSVTSGARRQLIDARGNQSAPAWSPDGRRIVFASSQAGGTQLFVASADGSGVRRLTTNNAVIDTAPNWAVDGKIYFMSDRGGSPQIYRIDPEGGNAERVSFEGSENANPKVAADGKSMVFVKREGGRYALAVQDFASRQVQTLTQGPVDESPSFAPNGKLIVYASIYNGRGVLAAVSSDGRVKQRLASAGADVREPAWGPLPR